MSKFQQILNSFSIKETLNPKVWENPDNPKKATMVPKVRKALERIAEEFVDYLGDNVFVEDVVLTGSLSNFNWSEFSDFDLHVIVDMDEYGDEDELYKELFNLKKQLFNTNHNIKIFGYDVELYAQDAEEPHSYHVGQDRRGAGLRGDLHLPGRVLILELKFSVPETTLLLVSLVLQFQFANLSNLFRSHPTVRDGLGYVCNRSTVYAEYLGYSRNCNAA